MEDLIRNLLARLGENPDREGLQRTPERVAESLREMTSGYGLDGAAILSEAVFPAESDGLVVCRDIRFVRDLAERAGVRREVGLVMARLGRRAGREIAALKVREEHREVLRGLLGYILDRTS